jgi:hypothetical protein
MVMDMPATIEELLEAACLLSKEHVLVAMKTCLPAIAWWTTFLVKLFGL